MTMGISAQHNDARLVGTIAFASAGSKIQFFTQEHPTLGGNPAEVPLVEIVLANPCGVVTAHTLVLQQLSSAGDLIVSTGSAMWARWVTGDGVLVADGTVSDAAGNGDFRISGTSGTTLYAGGRALLGASSLS